MTEETQELYILACSMDQLKESYLLWEFISSPLSMVGRRDFVNIKLNVRLILSV